MSQTYTQEDLVLFRQMVDRTVTTINDERISKLGSYALYHANNLTTLILPNAISIGEYACRNCSKLQALSLPNVTTINTEAFYQCYPLNSLILPKTNSIGSNAFGYCTNLKSAILNTKCSIGNSSFGYCYKLKELLLPDDTNGIYTVSRSGSGGQYFINSLSNTLISYGLGGIYVPSSLLETYKGNEMWSSAAAYIYSLDQYPAHHEDISDSWATIIENCDNNNVSSYNIGDIKEIETSDGDIWYAQIVAKGVDELSNGGGYAPLTWIMKHTYMSHAMHSRSENTSWGYCSGRTWLQSDVMNMLPQALQSGIKTVKKTYFNGYGKDTLTANDTLWIPSLREIYNGITVQHEDSGPVYNGIFSDANSRARTYLPTLSSNSYYWTRTGSSGTTFIYTNGNNISNASLTYNAQVLIGFCT